MAQARGVDNGVRSAFKPLARRSKTPWDLQKAKRSSLFRPYSHRPSAKFSKSYSPLRGSLRSPAFLLRLANLTMKLENDPEDQMSEAELSDSSFGEDTPTAVDRPAPVKFTHLLSTRCSCPKPTRAKKTIVKASRASSEPLGYMS
eukprot:1334777-Amorphochlora_amoeboformis.AAC.2